MITEKSAFLEIINNGNLAGVSPAQMLPHGPTKLLLDVYHWHSPDKGIVASYSPKKEMSGITSGYSEGVDQVEAFAQASVVSCATFLECRKQNCTPGELRDKFIPAFISIGQVNFHNYLEVGDTFISIGNITFYRWRQMVCNGRIYKIPKNLNLDDYFSVFDEERLLKYDISKDFILVAELSDITGRAIKIEFFKKEA